MTMTVSIQAAPASLVLRDTAVFIFRRIGAVLAALLLLIMPALAEAATRADASATRAGGDDPRFHALFQTWVNADRPTREDVTIPSGRPVDSANLTSGFGIRSDPFRARAAMHPGIDLAAPLGTPVYATADGVVDRSEWNDGGYGNLIEIDHGQGIQTRYGHLSQRIALAGQPVHKGDLIGLMGSTGRSTGSHLHYEVRVAGQAIDPISFVPNGLAMAAARRQREALAEGGPRSGAR